MKPSLLGKILLSTSLAVTALFAVTGWIVQDRFVRASSLNLEDEVRASFHAYESLWRARSDRLASVSLVLSRMSDVRAAFGTGDRATIRDTASEVWDKIARPGTLFLVTDPRGTVLASLGRTPNGIRELPIVRAAADQFPAQATGFLPQGGQLYQVVVTPVYVAAGPAAVPGSALLNVLVAGLVVDDEMAGEWKTSTGGSEFVFLSAGRVAASTLGPAASRQLVQQSGSAQRIQIGRSDYSQFSTPLLDLKGRPIGELRILRSFDAARARITALRNNMVALWLVAVVAGLGLTFWLARRILQPVQALDRAAAEIGEGNYHAHVPVSGNDELGRLARTFNNMCASIRTARQDLIRQERIATIGRLSTSIVHDLRNPLAAIYGGAEMLVDGDLAPNQVRRLAANIYRSSRRIQELLEELAGVTRGRVQGRETCVLREVVLAAYETLAPIAERQRVLASFGVPLDLELPLDRSPMERVFENLIGNALEAMPGGGWLKVTAARDADSVTVSIEDSGPGIPAEIAGSLFEPFVTARKKNGIGLGLALSRQTVLDHGGDLSLDARPSQGARFLLRLPA